MITRTVSVPKHLQSIRDLRNYIKSVPSVTFCSVLFRQLRVNWRYATPATGVTHSADAFCVDNYFQSLVIVQCNSMVPQAYDSDTMSLLVSCVFLF